MSREHVGGVDSHYPPHYNSPRTTVLHLVAPAYRLNSLTPIGEHAMTKKNFPSWNTLVVMTTVLLVFSVAVFVWAQVPRGHHGAADEAYQQRILDTLLPETYTTFFIPDGVDINYWIAFIPKDNEITPARIALGRKLYFPVLGYKNPRLQAIALL